MIHSIWSTRLPVAAAVCAAFVLASACERAREADTRQAPAPALLPEVIDDRPKILALGDSLTAGNGLLEVESYPAVLQRFIDADGYQFEVINGGASGDTSAGGLRRFDWLMRDEVEVLILALGANDGLRGLPPDQMKRNLAQIIERSQARGVTVVLAGMEAPPNFGPEYAAAYRRAFIDLSREYRVTYIPFLLADVAGVSHLNQADGVHPTAEGTVRVADTVWAALQPVLDLLSQ
ncbi:arylesterase [soil metagenome]